MAEQQEEKTEKDFERKAEPTGRKSLLANFRDALKSSFTEQTAAGFDGLIAEVEAAKSGETN